MRLALAVTMAVTLIGCATAYQQPPAPVWAYAAESAPLYGLRTVTYTETKEACELARAMDVHQTTKDHAYLGATYSPACQEALIGPGIGYWVYALSPRYGRGQAFGTAAQCEANRQHTAPPYVATSCAPISVHWLAPLQKGAQK